MCKEQRAVQDSSEAFEQEICSGPGASDGRVVSWLGDQTVTGKCEIGCCGQAEETRDDFCGRAGYWLSVQDQTMVPEEHEIHGKHISPDYTALNLANVFSGLTTSLSRSGIVVFAVAALLRSIPEVLAGKYPVGFDVNAYYPYLILSFPSISALDLLKAGPLFYGVMWFIQYVSGADVFLLLKIAGPVIYGILSASFLVFLVKFLKLSLQKASFGTVLLILQPIALRISWDLFRNELGLAFGLVALASLKTNSKQKYMIAGSLGLLAVLAHPLAAVLMFVGGFGLLLSTKLNIERLKIVISFAPSAILFLAAAFVLYFIPPGQSSVITLSADPNGSSHAVLYSAFLVQDGFLGPAHLDAIEHAGLLFFFSFAPILAFVAKGFWYERTLGAITAWTGLASFSFVLSPILSIPIYWRWEILLIFPFAIYSLKGLDKFGLFQPSRAFARRVLIGFFLLLALGYSTGALSYMGSYGVNSFAPGTMVQGTIRVDQVDAALSSLTWLRVNAPKNSILLTDERFISYARLSMGESFRLAVQPGGPPSPDAVSHVLSLGPTELFVIWDSGLALSGFSTVHTENGISIFQFTGAR